MSAAESARATVARAIIWNGGGWNPGTAVTLIPVGFRYNYLYNRRMMLYRATDDAGQSAVLFSNAIDNQEVR